MYIHVSDTYTGVHVNASNVQPLNCPINCPVRSVRPQLRSISRSLRINTSPPWEYTHPLCFSACRRIYIERGSVFFVVFENFFLATGRARRDSRRSPFSSSFSKIPALYVANPETRVLLPRCRGKISRFSFLQFEDTRVEFYFLIFGDFVSEFF